MTGRYERATGLGDALDRAGRLPARTVIVDVEPLVSWWGDSQDALDRGVAAVIGKVRALPAVRVLVFATNSARRPAAVPDGQDIEVVYLATAGKPVRTAPYRRLPRPGAVIGDQVLTDGLLAGRLGFTFLHCQPPGDLPLGPSLMRGLGRLALPLLFGRVTPKAPGAGSARGRAIRQPGRP